MADPLAELSALSLVRGEGDLDARERLLDTLTSAALPRSFVFATCHRVELYSVGPAPALRPGGARLLLGTAAARHLFRVASGLDSLIPGEIQVLGQLRRLRDSVRGEPLLEALVEHALRVGREVRARTDLGSPRRSLGSLAVDEALRFTEHPEETTALVVGAGDMGKLASRALRRRVRELLIVNRDQARAWDLAREIGAEVVPLSGIDGAIARAGVIISAADTRGTLLDARRLGARTARGPLVLVDLAVPRSVAADARGLRGLIYRTADDLRDASVPAKAAVEAAERRCERAAEAFARSWGGRAAVPVIRALRARSDEQRRRQLARALSKLGHLADRDRRVVTALAWSLTNSLLHEPTVALRMAPEHLSAARRLFGLEETSR